MQLPSLHTLLPKKSSLNQQYFLALAIGHESIEACVWIIDKGATHIVGTGKETYSNTSDWNIPTSRAVDGAVAAAGHNVTTVTFGLPDSWITEGALKAPHVHDLAALASSLKVEPSSFVSTVRAIAHGQKLKEGIPLTAICIGVEKKYATISVWQTGRLIGYAQKEITNTIGHTTDEAIKSFGEVEVLPARMLVYGTGDTDGAKQDLLAYPWMQRLNFLHFPKVDILPAFSASTCVAIASASDLGATYVEQPDRVPDIQEQETQESRRPFGFVQSDIAARAGVSLKPPQQEDEPLEKTEPSVPQYASVKPQFTIPEEGGWWFARITDRFGVWPFRFALVIGAFLLLASGLFALYWNVPKATVTLLLTPEPLERDMQVVIQEGAQLDVGAKVIPGTLLSLTQKASKRRVASGQKTIGDPARGEVTIFNKSTVLRKLAKGTILTAQGGGPLFQLQSDIDVASQSATVNADETVTLTPGKAKAEIVAQDIGDRGNVPTGTEFSVGSVPIEVLKAKNGANFSGGSSHQASVVTKADHDTLITDLSREMLEKDTSDLKGKLSEGNVLLPQAVRQAVVVKAFDQDVDKEASDVTLTLETKTEAIVFADRDLRELLRQSVANAVPQGFELLTHEVEPTTEVAKIEGGRVTLRVHFTANLLPTIEDSQVRQAIAGKKPEAAREILIQLPRVAEVTFELWPKLPDPLLTLPHKANRITLERAHR